MEQRNQEQQRNEVSDQQQDDVMSFDDPAADKALELAEWEASLRAEQDMTSFNGAATITTMIPLAELVTSLAFQIREKLDVNYVRRYMGNYENDGEMDPIVVASVVNAEGVPSYYLVDGFHRVEALTLLGRTEALAEIFPLPTLNDVRWKGFQINFKHGVHYTRAEREKGFKLYLAMGKHTFRPRPNAALELKSIRQIAREWGRTPKMIWKLIQELDKKLAAEYRQRAYGRKDRPATNLNAVKPPRQLAKIDVARRDLKNVLKIARSEAPDVQAQITRVAEQTVEQLRAINDEPTTTTTPWTPPWTPLEEDF